MVLRRKNEMGQKMSDFNSLVTNQVWSLIENENTFKQDDPAGLITKNDLLSFEKIQMQHDADFLSKIINFDQAGKMSVKLETNDYK
jgi:hypothetical protein